MGQKSKKQNKAALWVGIRVRSLELKSQASWGPCVSNPFLASDIRTTLKIKNRAWIMLSSGKSLNLLRDSVFLSVTQE